MGLCVCTKWNMSFFIFTPKKRGCFCFQVQPQKTHRTMQRLLHNPQGYNRCYLRLWFLNLNTFRHLLIELSAAPSTNYASPTSLYPNPYDKVHGISFVSCENPERLFCLRQYPYHAFSQNWTSFPEYYPFFGCLINYS